MDSNDKAILDIIQSDYPITERPYAAIGEQVGLSEDDVLARVRAMKDSGLIRRIGANFPAGKVGFHSTLCAAQVPQDKLEEFTRVVNGYPGVTHNYLRKHAMNVWFTYIGPGVEAVKASLAEIEQKTGIPVLYLPMERMYKIKVDFKMNTPQAEEPPQ